MACRLRSTSLKANQYGWIPVDVRNCLQLPFLLVQEYVEGRTLLEIAFLPDEKKRQWCIDSFGPEGEVREEHSGSDKLYHQPGTHAWYFVHTHVFLLPAEFCRKATAQRNRGM